MSNVPRLRLKRKDSDLARYAIERDGYETVCQDIVVDYICIPEHIRSLRVYKRLMRYIFPGYIHSLWDGFLLSGKEHIKSEMIMVGKSIQMSDFKQEIC